MNSPYPPLRAQPSTQSPQKSTSFNPEQILSELKTLRDELAKLKAELESVKGIAAVAFKRSS